MTTPDHTPHTPDQPQGPGHAPDAQAPPMPDRAPLQLFNLGVEISGHANDDPEAIRRLIGGVIMQRLAELSHEHGFAVTSLTTKHSAGVASTPQPAQGETAPADAAPAEESTEAPEPSLFTPETQDGFDTPITETFLSNDEVADINGEEPDEPETSETPEDESEAPTRPAVVSAYEATRDIAAEKLGFNKLVPLSDEQREAFAEALKEQGITSVRHAVILGLDTVRESVEYLRPKIKGRRRFDGEIATLTQGIVDAISDDAYGVLEKRPHDEDNGRPVDTPLSLEEIAKFCDDPAKIPARAVKTAAVQNFGHFPEFWHNLTLADLANPANHDSLIRRARDVRPEQAQKCLRQAGYFAAQLAKLTQNQNQ